MSMHTRPCTAWSCPQIKKITWTKKWKIIQIIGKYTIQKTQKRQLKINVKNIYSIKIKNKYYDKMKLFKYKWKIVHIEILKNITIKGNF